MDNNPEAVEICRLRLWLSMVLDMDDPPGSNSDWALPNLDFQIVAGDSLVDRVAGIDLQVELVAHAQGPMSTVGLELRQGSLRTIFSPTSRSRRQRVRPRTHKQSQAPTGAAGPHRPGPARDHTLAP